MRFFSRATQFIQDLANSFVLKYFKIGDMLCKLFAILNLYLHLIQMERREKKVLIKIFEIIWKNKIITLKFTALVLVSKVFTSVWFYSVSLFAFVSFLVSFTIIWWFIIFFFSELFSYRTYVFCVNKQRIQKKYHFKTVLIWKIEIRNSKTTKQYLRSKLKSTYNFHTF